MSASPSDVPERYDVVFSGGSLTDSYGFCFADQVEPSLPFRTHRAIYDISPTFIERSNVTGQFGDNQQDFWLTASQNDWSGGEDQKFLHLAQADTLNSYWQGQNVDNRTPGQVTIRRAQQALSLPSTVRSIAGARGFGAAPNIFVGTDTDLFEVTAGGTIFSRGPHGLGAAPSKFGMTCDGVGADIYMSTTAGGTTGVRRWNGSFSQFSLSPADSLVYLNNTLFGYRANNSDFVRWDTAGNLTSIFSWRSAAAGIVGLTSAPLRAYGGKVLFLETSSTQVNLWIYDGVGVSLLQSFPEDFAAVDMVVNYGIVFISGYQISGSLNRQVIYYYANGTPGVLWKSQDATGSSGGSSLTEFSTGIVWRDMQNDNQYMFYDPASGSISRFSSSQGGGAGVLMASARGDFIDLGTGLVSTQYPASYTASSAVLKSSLIDFDSSLDKLFRGIKVDFTGASDGNSGSVDIAYQVGDVSGSYTTLQSGAVSGTEYQLPVTIGRNLSVQITLNKGTSALGPVLKRIYVRAAPVLQHFRSGLYIFGLEDYRPLRDGMNHPLTGGEMAKALLSLAQQQTPFTCTDRFGSFTALVDVQDADGFDIYETHPASGMEDPRQSGTYICRIKVREV